MLENFRVWYSNGPNVSGCQMVWISNGGLKTIQKMPVLWSEMSGIWIVGLIKGSDHLKTGKKCPKSKMFGFQVLGIQIILADEKNEKFIYLKLVQLL